MTIERGCMLNDSVSSPSPLPPLNYLGATVEIRTPFPFTEDQCLTFTALTGSGTGAAGKPALGRRSGQRDDKTIPSLEAKRQ